MATTTRKQRSTDTRTTPHSLASKASVKFGFVVRPRRSRADPTSTKTHRSHATTPNEATTRADEPSWHQLLGTLLSSQRTDAHPSFALASSRPEATVQTYPIRSGRSSPGGPSRSSWIVPRRGDVRAHASRSGRTRGWSSGGPATGLILGVRSSLPGDEEEHYARLGETVNSGRRDGGHPRSPPSPATFRRPVPRVAPSRARGEGSGRTRTHRRRAPSGDDAAARPRGTTRARPTTEVGRARSAVAALPHPEV